MICASTRRDDTALMLGRRHPAASDYIQNTEEVKAYERPVGRY